ncbi:AI-2E family transporter [Marinibacterium profundimaris]|uniref:AI-2E family transporter n=1 Tax=Marinibacterium profundimaris TaxID=1679460 RepID=UPI0018E9B9E4|nr:AI-2E family transporter [Marinibacterium profundimaris]
MSDNPAGSEPPEPAANRHLNFAPRWAVIGIFLIMLVGSAAYARSFLMPVVLAVLLQLVFAPVRRKLARWGIAPGIAAGLIVTTLLSLLLAGAISLSGPVKTWVDRAPMIGFEIREKMDDLREVTEGVQKAAQQVDEITSPREQEEEPGVQRVRVEEDTGLLAYALSLPWVIAQIVFTLILMFFLLASGDMFYEKLVYVLPTFRDKRQAIQIAYDIERKLSRYLFTITLINACLGMSIGLAMYWFGMPNPILFGVLGFLLNFIPYLGAIIGVGVATMVAFVSLDLAQEALLVGGVYFALTSIEGQFATPYFVGRNLRLNTVVVFLSVTFFAWLWSVVGMLVATPLLVALRTFCEHIPALQGVGHFLSARGDETEEKTPAEL